SAVQLAEAGQHRLGVVPAPTSPRATHPEMDHVLAPAFDRAAPDRVSLRPKLLVAHTRQVGLEVATGLPHLIGDRRLFQVEGAQRAYDRPSLTSPQSSEVGFHPRFRSLAPLAVHRLTDGPQPTAGMAPVHDLY